jgi:preprotein translocase subunit SecA
VTHTIFRVSIQRDEQPQQPQPRRMTEGRIDLETGALAATGTAAATAGGGNGNGAGGQRPEPVRAGPKIGRNDPCWCGSGKKYKRCHGA